MKAKIAQNNSQVSEGGITVKPGQDSIHELIIWKVNPFVASVTCSQYQIAFKWSVNFWLHFLVYDEMENISKEAMCKNNISLIKLILNRNLCLLIFP